MRDPMVLATASTETIHHDLKSLPGGFVEARRLTYGEKIQRRAMVSGLKVKMQDRKRKGQQTDDGMEGEMNLVNEAATLFDFQKCIVDHNLEAEIVGPTGVVGEGGEPATTRKLDLSNASDIKKLDPRVGEEIDVWLSELNNFDEDSEGEE
jgi:hypothetical protein